MKVVFIQCNDYANLNYGFAEALKSVGIDAKALTLTPHRFGYEKQAYHVDRTNMFQECEAADLIIIGHSDVEMLNMVRRFPNKRIWAEHTGTPYRQNSQAYNDLFNPIVERTLIDSPEFATLGAKNITYIAAAIDTDKIKFAESKNERLVFAHYPSKAETKGTMRIAEMMTNFDVEFICNTDVVSHEENLKRMGECDVYIEMHSPLQKGKQYGSFGVTASEAAALGKIVVTNSAFHNVYNQAYGFAELCVANDERGFKCVIGELIRKERWDIEIMQRKSRKWIVDNHSLQATGKYLAALL